MQLRYEKDMDIADELEEHSINYGPLSISKINRIVGDMYQVDCNYCIFYSKLFQDLNEAIDKFKELMKALKGRGYVC